MFKFHIFIALLIPSALALHSPSGSNDSLPYLWPLPSDFTSGNATLSVDPQLSLAVAGNGGNSAIVKAAFDRYRGILFMTFSQLCTFNYETKDVQIYQAPWYIKDSPRFSYRGLLIDTSRHFLPVDVIKHIIESMSYAKLNVLHWHMVDEESFPLEVPSYPNLWKGAYTKHERYTIEDAYDIVTFAKMRGKLHRLKLVSSTRLLNDTRLLKNCFEFLGINVMAEVDVPGHAESWGVGYPNLWPSPSCKEPLDVTKNFTFDLISGILTDLRKIFPFELFHLGGDEVNTDCWETVPHVKQWEETFVNFPEGLNPSTIVHNWYDQLKLRNWQILCLLMLRGGICPKAVAHGFRCIFSDQGVWYLDHLDVPWDRAYRADPLEGVSDFSQQKLIIGGEACMWGETADASNVQQTIWPRAATAAERLWSKNETVSGNITVSVLPRLSYFRCLLNRRGVEAAPVKNFYARRPPTGPGSCYDQ
ncbi:Beta-hexosaminidase 1, partial [Cucurbita argyrosperma subsp. argyrosperma]